MINQDLISRFVEHAREGRIDSTVSILANHPGIINKPCQNHRSTALIAACAGKQQEIAIILIKFGADVNIKNKHGLSPLHWAMDNKLHNAINLLLVAGAESNDHEKTRLKNSIKQIISFNYDDDAIFEYVTSIVNRGKVQLDTRFVYDIIKKASAPHNVVTFLICSTSNEITSLTDNNGMTLLHHATVQNEAATVELLLLLGADPNATALENCYDYSEMTALDIAKKEKHELITEILKPITEERTQTFANRFLASMAEL